MKRLLPAVVLTFAASASCVLDLKGLPGSGGGPATATSTAGPGGGATASGSTTGAGGAGGVMQSTSSATSSSTGPVGPVWTRRRKLDLDSGVNAALSSFSILVLLDKGRIDYGQTQDQGQDLRFTDDQNNVLDHEIERWDESGTSVVWVRIPSLTKSGSPLATIWMYYGNDTVLDGQNVEGVWDDLYHGVWHLGEDGDVLSDSSGEMAKKATNHGTTPTTGLVGKGRSFNAGAHQYIDTNNTDQLSTFTIEVCVRGNNLPATSYGPNGLLMREQNYQLLWDDNGPNSGSATFKPAAALGTVSSSMLPLKGNTWYYLAATYDGTTLRTYKDGAHQSSSDVTASPPELTGLSAKLGRHTYGVLDPNFFNGDIDEVRIAGVSRPEEWFIAQDRSIRDKLVKLGPEEITKGPWALP